MAQRLTPSVGQWLGYAFGRGLPAAQRDWVRMDLLGPRWVLRHFVRTLVQWTPSLLLLLLSGPVVLRLSLPFLVLLGCLYVSASYLHETRAHRLLKNGLTIELAAQADRDRAGARDVVRHAELATRRAALRQGRDRSFRRW